MKNFRDYDFSNIVNAKRMRFKAPKTFYTFIATWFFIGLIGIMPGTLGSIASYPLYIFIYKGATSNADFIAKIISVTVLIFVLGWWAINKFQKVTNSFDHQCVVVDEVIGMLIVIAGSWKYLILTSQMLYKYIDLSPPNLSFVIAFITFRYFDIKKPLFIKYFDRKYKNAFGVILDDVLAALFSIGTIYIIYEILNKII
jgi:phosphatidylglycerophosphatase A